MQTNFASGELSPLLNGRTDLDQYYKGAQQAENVLVVPQGGLKRRPGTQFLAEARSSGDRYIGAATMPNGGNAAQINDGNDNTVATTNVLTTGEDVIAHYDLGEAKAVTFVDMRNMFTSNSTAIFYVEYSTDNTNWSIAFAQVFDTTPSNKRQYAGATARYWRLRKKATDVGFSVTLGEFNLRLTTATFTTSSGATVVINEWDVKPNLLEFNMSDIEKYLVVITYGNIDIYRTAWTKIIYDGTQFIETDFVASIRSPWGFNPELFPEWTEVRGRSTENVMLFFQENYPVQRLIRDSGSFQFDAAPLYNIPQFDYDDDLSPTPTSAVQVLEFIGFTPGQKYQINVEGVFSKEITYAGDTTADQQDSTAFNLQKNLQDMPNFGFTGITVIRTNNNEYTITLAGESAGIYKLFTGFPTSEDSTDTISFTLSTQGASRKEDVWSSNRGYPRNGVFYNGRLVIGGTKSKPQSLFASRVGGYFDFFIEKGDDDEGIFVTIDSNSTTRILDINPDRGLQVFTTGAEFLVKGNTPSTVTIEAQTQHGSADVPVAASDGSILFVDANQKTIRQYLFNFNEDAFASADISVLSSHLIKKPVDMAILNGTTTEDSNWLFVVNDDGSVAVLNTLRAQDINGWTEWKDADGKVESCAAIGDYIFTSVKRNGRTTLEQWDFDRMLDSSIEENGPIASTISGLDHLEGKTVAVIGMYGTFEAGIFVSVTSRNLLTERVVSGGSITLDADERSYDRYEVGLPFEVNVRPMAPNTSAGTRAGQNVMREKKLVRMNVRFYKSAGIYIDGNPVPIRQFGSAGTLNSIGTAITAVSGIVEDNNGGNGWGIDVSPLITGPDSMPFQIQSIECEVESS
jgi:hypothetical protein